jgi:hypothetical protein
MQTTSGKMIETLGTLVILVLTTAAIVAIVVFSYWFIFIHYPGGAGCWFLDQVVVGDLLRFFEWLTDTHSACR